MSSAAFVNFALGFILMQLIVIDIARSASLTEYRNVTHYPFKRISERFKRSPPAELPQQLKLRVKLPTGEEYNLNWIKKHNYLANQYLTVVITSDLSDSKVMENLKEFELYHDIDKCSAAVYFRKDNTLYGVVGLDSTITALPYEFDSDGSYPTIIEAPYITKRADSPVHNDPIMSGPNHQDVCNAVGNKRGQSDSDPGPSNKHQRTERNVDDGDHRDEKKGNMTKIRSRRRPPSSNDFHLEILIFVTSDVAQFFKNLYGINYLEWIVRYFIIYFTAIDMTFEQQRILELNLHINIAKIVVEDNAKPFDFIDHDVLQFTDTVKKLRRYLKTNRRTYAPESFDHVFISTSRPIMDGSTQVYGTRDFGIDFYEAREKNEFYEGIPITIVGFLHDYVHAVYEISRTLRIDSDPWSEGLTLNGQCYSIMQEGSARCDKCFKWSEDSKEQFKTFFRSNRNRCSLLNEPRSIRPPGTSRFVTPLRQCQCYGYDFHVQLTGKKSRSYISQAECNLPLVCGKKVDSESIYEYTVSPFDGTNCAGHKVCWNKVCTRLENYFPMRTN